MSRITAFISVRLELKKENITVNHYEKQESLVGGSYCSVHTRKNNVAWKHQNMRKSTENMSILFRVIIPKDFKDTFM